MTGPARLNDAKGPAIPKRQRVVTITGEVQKRNYTIYDLINLKGLRRLVQIMAFTLQEGAAAEAAGIDMINIRWTADRPEQAIAIRKAAPETFMTFCMPPNLVANETEALRAAFCALEAGADGIYCTWSFDFIAAMAAAGVPVMGHAGLVPRKSMWTGGLRSVGKTLAQARAIFEDLKRLEDAGAWAVECEVIPHNVMALLSRNTGLVTISLGSGAACDVQHLFSEDILGMSGTTPPRHAKSYRNFHELNEKLQRERIAAFAEYVGDVRSGAFPSPAHLVQAEHSVVTELEKAIAQNASHK